ncbi:pentapeptide repeat-containing protein [Amycolatopsis cynarae]|uniref:Pentapeptide repeat-containing protein n=1 Tax=Amycolatopsis cynarae TaxID=2995223 RepID=A0ABY7BAW4_9PSEU|nr:pentapeptide repeat-containing protein [Amycolatopsis sp. HUAS 11-8]WAL68823.1 pentapeptide repeat-containing protein [Amycolatopsis sp. HUAS 11-8]
MSAQNAIFSGATLAGATLPRANLNDADLRGAIFYIENIDDRIPIKVSFELTKEQIESALIDDCAILPPELDKVVSY